MKDDTKTAAEHADNVTEMQTADTCEAKLLAIDPERRRITHVISTARLDRGNRIVEPSGWKLANFKRAPRVLADHDYSIERVIGTGHDLKVVDVPRIGEALVATTQFAEQGAGEVAFQLASTGIVNSWSVGWMGLKSHRIGEVDDCEACAATKNVDFGRHFITQELLEYSLVAIPANPDAVNGLMAAGLVSKAAAEEWNEAAFEATRKDDAEDETDEPETFTRSVAFSLELNALVRAESIRAASSNIREQIKESV